MEYDEFAELAEQTIEQLLDRIPERYRKPIGSLMYAGEEREAVTNLAATVADDQVPVTADERDDLRRLLEYLKEPTGTLSRLNVAPEPPTT